MRSLADLVASLDAMTILYVEAPAEVRTHVIVAKDRAKWAARNPKVSEEKRTLKTEMAHWMLVWLDDPAMFSTWVRLRLTTMNEQTIKCDVCGGSGQCTTCKGTGNGGQCFNCAGTGNCPQCQGTGRRKTD